MRKRPNGRGFTLVEVMVVVFIVGLLAAVAIPAYRKSVQKSNRSVAKSALLDLASREEKYYSINYNYTNTMGGLYGTTSTSAVSVNAPSVGTPLYTITVSSITAQSSTGGVVTPAAYTLLATAVNGQAGDSCGNFTLSSTGAQSVSGTNSGCW